jgi:hypothetical protein
MRSDERRARWRMNSANVAPRRIAMHSSSTRAELRSRTAIRRQELAASFVRINEVAQNKAGREFTRQIGMFRPKNDKPLQ